MLIKYTKQRIKYIFHLNKKKIGITYNIQFKNNETMCQILWGFHVLGLTLNSFDKCANRYMRVYVFRLPWAKCFKTKVFRDHTYTSGNIAEPFGFLNFRSFVLFSNDSELLEHNMHNLL